MKTGLFPGKGKTASSAHGGGKTKTEWYLRLAEAFVYTLEGQPYRDAFKAGDSAPAKQVWGQKMKNRLNKCVTSYISQCRVNSVQTHTKNY
jgi:hypothetical protein